MEDDLPTPSNVHPIPTSPSVALVPPPARAAVRARRSRASAVVREPATLAEVWARLRDEYAARGVPEHGVVLLSRLRRRLLGIGERTTGFPPVRLALLEGIAPARTAGRWIAELAPFAAAHDPLAAPGDPPARVTASALAAAGIDAVLVLPRGLDLAHGLASTAACALTRPWSALSAVRGRRLFVGDGALLDGQPAHVVTTLEVIAEILHPSAFRFGHEGRYWRRAT